MHPPIKKVRYAFDASQIHPRLAAAHVVFAQHALAVQFGIDESEIQVATKHKGSDTSLQMTCYVSASVTSAPAMVIAMRCVSPHLDRLSLRSRALYAAEARDARQAEAAKAIASWVPQACPHTDKLMLKAIAKGLAGRLSRVQGAYVRSQAARGVARPGAMSRLRILRAAKAALWLQSARPKSPRVLSVLA